MTNPMVCDIFHVQTDLTPLSPLAMIVLVISLLVCGVSGFYSSGDGVEVLTPANFDSKVKNDEGLWIIEFYAPW